MAAGIVFAFALVHAYGGRLRFLSRTPRSVWLSVGGGVSVAYVFLHLLPDLQRSQQRLEQMLEIGGWLNHHIYLMALAGLTLFYGLERLACRSRGGGVGIDEGQSTPQGVYTLHISAFAIYNFAVGVLLATREEGSLGELVLYGVALALHFLVNDYGLRNHHRARYQRHGRWLLAAAVVLGWLTGLFAPLPPLTVEVAVALLAGGIVMNVMKEELPGERESRFSAFLAGVVLYGALLVSVG
ncbi:hypothetical protein EZ242_08920 [Ramlibacter rhizophilus]|uniref:ZIP family metal transporter n=1 Tax=Ramlibacter rhizophilus TaxID=1781167 RepID=A0A4Z0BTA4_9BURK|nr:hypothetical protein EZ242_08920 [Ramlibacter rhizophilus]